MLMAGPKIIRHEGDTYPIDFSLVDGTTGDPYDLTGMTIEFRVAPSAQAATNIFVSAGTLTDEVNGKVSFPMNGAAAIAAVKGAYVYQVRLDTGSELITFMEGLFDLQHSLFN